MELTVRAFNEGYELANLCTGILHFLNSGGWRNLIFIVMCLTFVVALIGAARKIQIPMLLLMAFFFPLSLYIALISVKVQLNIQDEYTYESYTLSNVPFGIAMPLAVSSQLEMGLTELIDENVRPASDPSFFNVDFMGSARMMNAVTDSNLYNVPHIIKTIAEYGKYCVIPALSSGDLTYDQIQREPDLLAYLNLGYQVFFSTIYYAAGGSSLNTCDAVYQWIISELGIYTNLGYGSSFGNQVTSYMGRRGNNVALASATLAAGVSSMFSGFQDSSEQLFSQLFIMNGLKSTLSLVDPTLGLSVSEVETKQISAQTVAGILNIKHLSRYRTFLKLFLIAIMPIVASFWFFNFGRAFGIWCGIFLWVSLFLPMEAAIHAVYTAATLADLRNFTDPFGGFTFLTQPSVLKWATETNAMAANLMLGIFAFSALVLKMSVPAVGQAVMSMITASQNQTRFQSQAASNVLEATERRGVGMASDRMAEMMLTKGQYRSALNSADHAQLSAFSGKMGGDNLFGNDPTVTRSNANDLRQQMGGSASLSAQVTDSMMTSASNAVTNAAGQVKNTLDGYRSSFMRSASADDNERFVNGVSNLISDTDRSDFNKTVGSAFSIAHDKALQTGRNEEEATRIGMLAKASAAASFGGWKLSLGGEAGYSQTDSLSKSGTTRHAVNSNEIAQRSAAEALSHANTVSTSDGHEESRGTSESARLMKENVFSELTNTTSSYMNAKAHQQALSSLRSVGGSVAQDVDQSTGQTYDKGAYVQIRGEAPEVNKVLNRYGMNAEIGMLQAAASKDIRNAIMGGNLAPLVSSMARAGFKHMDRIGAIADAGGTISGSLDGHQHSIPQGDGGTFRTTGSGTIHGLAGRSASGTATQTSAAGGSGSDGSKLRVIVRAASGGGGKPGGTNVADSGTSDSASNGTRRVATDPGEMTQEEKNAVVVQRQEPPLPKKTPEQEEFDKLFPEGSKERAAAIKFRQELDELRKGGSVDDRAKEIRDRAGVDIVDLDAYQNGGSLNAYKRFINNDPLLGKK
jgi:hypothetical protein